MCIFSVTVFLIMALVAYWIKVDRDTKEAMAKREELRAKEWQKKVDSWKTREAITKSPISLSLSKNISSPPIQSVNRFSTTSNTSEYKGRRSNSSSRSFNGDSLSDLVSTWTSSDSGSSSDSGGSCGGGD